jgi:uncharacterized protein (UPF0371 family)
MGVNRAGFGIVDDEAVREAARQEVVRRYFRYSYEYIMGLVEKDTLQRAELIMKEMDLTIFDRKVVERAWWAAKNAEQEGKGIEQIYCGAALELKDGSIITGRNSPLMHAASCLVINAIKKLAGIGDSIDLLSPGIIESIGSLKKDILRKKGLCLDLEETLIALSICAYTNPTAKVAMEKLKELAGCEIHMTHIPTPGDEAGLRRLGVNLTTDPNFASKDLHSV